MHKQTWNSDLYRDKHSYVYKYGEEVVNLLEPSKGEKILDLGCGTGYLTNLIASSGAVVVGSDRSPEMIEDAKKNFPEIQFLIEDATKLDFKEEFDSVFSNAVLHWIKEKEKVIDGVYKALKYGGKFVAEFGGKNNISRIENAVRDVLREQGLSENAKTDIWYYPSVGEYTTLLEKAGFTVNYVKYFKRDTFLNPGDDIGDWLEMFGKQFFKGIKVSVKKEIINQIQERLKETNYKKEKWFIDYIRLRFSASKLVPLTQ